MQTLEGLDPVLTERTVPMRSQAQRRWMHATHPAMANRWERETPSGALPEKVSPKARAAKALLRTKR